MSLYILKNTKPKRSLGQNYLIDENICRNIVNTFDIKPGENILEIGPGKGAITKFLFEKTKNLKVIELDEINCRYLNETFPGLEIISGDFLKTDLSSLMNSYAEKLRVIGNIPYNITSPIIFRLMDNRKLIYDAQLMIQEEVARRITASPGNKEYGIPSVLLNVFCRTKLLFKVSRNCFYPKPKVDSRIIYLNFADSQEERLKDKDFFRKIVKAAFGTRRKTLRNSLKNLNLNLEKTDIDMGRRAESLTIDEFIVMANKLC